MDVQMLGFECPLRKRGVLIIKMKLIYFLFFSFPSDEKGREGLHLMLVRFSGLPSLQNCEPNERLIYKLPRLWYFVIAPENGFRQKN